MLTTISLQKFCTKNKIKSQVLLHPKVICLFICRMQNHQKINKLRSFHEQEYLAV